MAKSKTNMTLEISEESYKTFLFRPAYCAATICVPLPGIFPPPSLPTAAISAFYLYFSSIHTEALEPHSPNLSQQPITDIIHYQVGAKAGKVIFHSKSHRARTHVETFQIFKSQIQMIPIELALVS